MCAQRIHCRLNSANTDAATTGVAIGVTVWVTHVHAGWSKFYLSGEGQF